MFDFGWAEFLIIITIALFVIGPQDIPKIAYQIGKAFRRIKYMQYALMGQFDDFMETAEAKDKSKKSKKDDDEAPVDDMDEAEADLLDVLPPENDTEKKGKDS